MRDLRRPWVDNCYRGCGVAETAAADDDGEAPDLDNEACC